jgi:hypothetical protein
VIVLGDRSERTVGGFTCPRADVFTATGSSEVTASAELKENWGASVKLACHGPGWYAGVAKRISSTNPGCDAVSYGFSCGYPSALEALNAALDECSKRGVNCRDVTGKYIHLNASVGRFSGTSQPGNPQGGLTDGIDQGADSNYSTAENQRFWRSAGAYELFTRAGISVVQAR